VSVRPYVLVPLPRGILSRHTTPLPAPPTCLGPDPTPVGEAGAERIGIGIVGNGRQVVSSSGRLAPKRTLRHAEVGKADPRPRHQTSLRHHRTQDTRHRTQGTRTHYLRASRTHTQHNTSSSSSSSSQSLGPGYRRRPWPWPLPWRHEKKLRENRRGG